MKKLLLSLVGVLCSFGATWADTAVLSFNMGENGAEATSANSITGASGCDAEGFSIAITGNSSKTWSGGNGSISYNSKTYKTLKNSNGAQNTITLPTGCTASQVDFYVVSNADAAAKLSEINGETKSDNVTSLKDYENPTHLSYSLPDVGSFTFTFSTKQVCFIAVVTYSASSPRITASNATVIATQSGVAATANINVAGSNLTGSTLTATISPAVSGLSVSLASNTVTSGSIETTATVSYTTTENVPQGTTTLTLSDGTTNKNVTITYSAHVSAFSQQNVTDAMVWDWSKAASSDIKLDTTTTPKKDEEILMANVNGVNNDANFASDRLLIAGEYIWRSSGGFKFAQIKSLKFHTTLPGVISVEFSNTGNRTADTDIRFVYVNGTKVGTGSKVSSTTTTVNAFAAAGDVSLTFFDNKSTPAETYVRVMKVSFTPGYGRTVTSGNFGTICLPNAVAAADRSGATFYNVAGVAKSGDAITGVVLEEETGALVAGKPYVFKATDATLTAAYSGDAVAEAVTATGLVGTLAAEGISLSTEGKYILSNNKICKLAGGTATIAQNRAYFDLDAVSVVSAPSAHSVIIDVEEEGAANGLDSVAEQHSQEIYDLTGRRVSAATKGMFIINGKKVVVK